MNCGLFRVFQFGVFDEEFEEKGIVSKVGRVKVFIM